MIGGGTGEQVWTERTAGGSYTDNFGGVAYGNGLFVAVGISAEIQTSPDGITWTQRTAAGGYTNVFRGVTYVNGFFVAVGYDGEIQTSPDGITWTQRTAAGSYTGYFYGVTYAAGLFVAVGQIGEIQTASEFTYNTATEFVLPTFSGSANSTTYIKGKD